MMEKNRYLPSAGERILIRENRLVEERPDSIVQYERAKARLLDVTHWGDFAHEAPEGFILTDALGNVVTRSAAEGDHIKVHLPGPHSAMAMVPVG